VSVKSHFLVPLLGDPGPGWVLRNSRSGQLIATRLELAADSESRRRGLLGRDALAEEAAFIIAPCNAIHTFFMRFTIDVVFANRQGQVVKLCRHLKPWRIGVGLKAFAAIEMAAGSIERTGITKGDRLAVAREEDVEAGSLPPS